MKPTSSKQIDNVFTWKFWLLIALSSFSGGLYSIIGYGNYLEQHIHHCSLCLADEVVAFAFVASVVVGPPAGWLIAQCKSLRGPLFVLGAILTLAASFLINMKKAPWGNDIVFWSR